MRQKKGNTAKSPCWMRTKSKTKFVNYAAIHPEQQNLESLCGAMEWDNTVYSLGSTSLKPNVESQRSTPMPIPSRHRGQCNT